MKSRVFSLSAAVSLVKKIAEDVSRDGLTLYAAQASFFAVTSAVPFVSLMIAIAGTFLPSIEDILLSLTSLPEGVPEVVGFILEGVKTAPGVSLLSISALTTLWSASRGISAVRRGIEGIYKASHRHGYVERRLRSLLSTVLFILVLVVSVASLFFGESLLSMIGSSAELLSCLLVPTFMGVMSVVFAAMYSSIAKRSTTIPSGIRHHIWGGILSSLGWVAFSYLYSVYLELFPRASYIYGSLGALCLIMLWVYFCMVILLFGAEANKYICSLKKQ